MMAPVLVAIRYYKCDLKFSAKQNGIRNAKWVNHWLLLSRLPRPRQLTNTSAMTSSLSHLLVIFVTCLPAAPAALLTPKARAKAAAETRKMDPEQKKIHKAKKAKAQLIARMGIDPEHSWKANYKILPGKEKVVSELKKFAKDSDTIYLATDLDREGEAIAWHLREAIGGDDSRYKRVVFNEITKKAIRGSLC